MKKYFKIITFALVAICLSSCDLLGKLVNDNYSDYPEYFQKEKKFTKYNDVSLLNQEIANTSYFWSMSDTSSDYTSYVTGKSISILVYKNETKVLVSFIDGSSFSVRTSNNKLVITNSYVTYDTETGERTQASTGKEDSLKVAKDSGGFLVVCNETNMVYITSDFKNVYANEKNTNVFQGYSDTKTIPSSDLLTNTLQALGNESRVQLPAPSNEYEIWYGLDYYKEKPSHGTAYIVDVDPNDYVKVLKNNGFSVIRSYEDEFYAFYGKDGGYWYCYDEKEEMELLVGMEYYLYTNNMGKTYGPWKNTKIWFYRMQKGYFGEKERTTNTDWSDYDRQNMAGWYDGTIDATQVPFIPLASSYMVPSANLMSYAHEGLLDGTLKLHSKCYNIYDNSPYYYLDGYNQILENAGFHKYVPSYDLSDYDQKKAFQNTEDSKYIECFINDQLDIAVKYYFDVNNGNTIRVFKKSEMKSWLQDEK